MTLLILVPLIVVLVLTIGVTFLLLWIARYVGGSKLVWLVGSLIVGYFVYVIIDQTIICGAEPVFVPPNCDDSNDCGDGEMIFKCDGPGGALTYGIIYIVLPLSIFAVSILGRVDELTQVQDLGFR